jgi:uncharacterized protein YqeY
MPTIKEHLDIDLKTALLAGDKAKAETLRGLKSVILYAEVANGSRESGGIDEAAVTTLLAKESKKRQESAGLYIKGGAQDKADKELSEKAIIDGYLPKQLSEGELQQIVQRVIMEEGAVGPSHMGQIISAVKGQVGAAADGGQIAKIVKESLAK